MITSDYERPTGMEAVLQGPVKDVASLHSQLSFVARIVKPGHIFLRRIMEEMQRGQTMESQIQLSE